MAAPEQQTVVQATPNIANDMSELIGRTPMVYLNRVTAGNVAKVRHAGTVDPLLYHDMGTAVPSKCRQPRVSRGY